MPLAPCSPATVAANTPAALQLFLRLPNPPTGDSHIHSNVVPARLSISPCSLLLTLPGLAAAQPATVAPHNFPARRCSANSLALHSQTPVPARAPLPDLLLYSPAPPAAPEPRSPGHQPLLLPATPHPPHPTPRAHSARQLKPAPLLRL